MLLNNFKGLVDRFSATIISNDLSTAYAQLGLDGSTGCSSREVSDKLYSNIRESLQSDVESKSEYFTFEQIKKLQKELIYRHVLYGEDPVLYLRTLRVIQDSCRNDIKYFPPFTEIDKWSKAIINGKNYNNFSPSTHSIAFGNLRQDSPKDFDRATSVKKLIGKGCEIEIINSDIFVNTGLEIIITELNERVKEIGGISLAKCIFLNLVKLGKYSTRFERYFITRQASGLSYDQRPQLPFGFLLNLSLRYPFENSQSKDFQSKIDHIVELSIIITNGAYGVQHYNQWEYHFKSGETIIQFSQEIALWDSIFSIPQCRPKTALEITGNLFSFIEDTVFESILKFTLHELIVVANEIDSISNLINGPIIIYHSSLCKKLTSIDKSRLLLILDFLSHSNKVNENYILPSDYSKIDFFLKPLLKLGNTKFILMDKSWCSPNYYEAIATALRTKISDLDSKIGNQLEIFLQKKLTGKGIAFSTGNYHVDEIDGECDLVIESEKGIILIEFKKKVLTRKSKSGIDINILLDLADSILAAQLQAGRTEIILREKGSITLTSKGQKNTIVNFKDRKIERVALTQLEFGGFQDRTIINEFLKSLLTHNFGTSSIDSVTIKKFEELTKMQNIWGEQYDKLHDLDEGFAHFPYFNCWFLSLSQLLEVINISTDNDSFYKNFCATKYITTNSLDWYKEFDYANSMSYSLPDSDDITYILPS